MSGTAALWADSHEQPLLRDQVVTGKEDTLAAAAPAEPAGEGMITTPRMAAAATLAAALACMIGLYVVALMINAGAYNDRDPFRLGAGISTFALLFVLALAVERVVQPISPILGPNTEVVKAQVKNAQVDGKIAEEEAKEKMDDARDKTAIVTWGFATGLAAVASAGLNITLIATLVDTSSTRPPYWLDLAITALVVGAGTKPLNDLVTKLQKKNS